MLRKVGLTTALLLALPAFANAWTITAKVSSGHGAITSDRTTTSVHKTTNPPAIAYLKTATNTGADTTQVLTFAADPGYQVSTVVVDGVNKGKINSYTLAMGATPTNHSVIAYYSAITYSLTADQAAGGTVTIQRISAVGAPKGFGPISRTTIPNLKDGDLVRVTAMPNTDYKVTSVAGVPLTGDAGEIQFTDITYNHNTASSTTATFAQVPQVAARLAVGTPVTSLNGYAGTVQKSAYATGEVIPVDVTSTTGNGTITYDLTAFKQDGTTPATGATFTGLTGVSFSTAGKYVVKLTASIGAVSSVVNSPIINVVSPVAAASAYCTGCHAQRNPDVLSSNVACSVCHSSQATAHKYGAIADAYNKFTASVHWNSPTGHETEQDFIAAGHGSVASCAAKCHFNQGSATGCAVCHSDALQAGGTIAFATTTSVHGGRPANVDNTCYSCHTGSKHGWSPRAFEKSSHFTGDHAKLYYQFDKVKCLNCHDQHSTEATMTDGKTDSCAKCHHYSGPTPDKNYGLYSSNGQGRAPHFGGVKSSTTSNGAQDNAKNGLAPAQTQFVAQGAICVDCHAHDNTINAGYAESGHGKISTDPMNAFVHYDWTTRKAADNGSSQNGNCNRCHTTQGFIRFAQQDADKVARLALQAGQPNGVLLCITCHKALEGEGLENAPLRTDAVPSGNQNLALSAGYFATFSSSGTAVAAGQTKMTIKFPGYKNSSICIPCHSGRSTAAVFTAVIDKAKTANYTTIQTSYYQHAANMGQTFLGQGAFDFTGARIAAANSHANVKNGSSDSQGPCVGCHYNKAGATHSLEVANFDVCATCHLPGFGAADLAAAEEKFAAGVKVLDALIKQKMEPLRVDASKPLSEERVYIRFAQLNRVASDNVTDANGTSVDKIANRAKKGYGAWYNWQILVTYDKAAFAHNPGYARQILFDTIDYLDDGSINNSAEATITASTAVTAAEKTAAAEYFIAPCATCHAPVAEKVQEGKHAYEVSTHSGSCGRCHTTEGYTAYAATNPDFTAVISTAYNGGSNVSCAACHDSHGTLRDVANASFNPTITGTADASQQFKLCTSCHNLVNNFGVPVASGLAVSGTATVAKQQHSKDWYRNIASTHYDLPTTGFGLHTTVVEGYNVRYNKASACTDCHGHELYTNTNGVIANPKSGEETVHTEWASSGHAGKILLAKFGAFTTAGNHARNRTVANAAAVMAAGVTGTTGPAWEHYDWDNSSGDTADRKSCQKCHTATGAANFLTNPATYSATNNNFSHLVGWTANKKSPQNEVLYCWGCHSDAGTGALRNPGAIPADYKFQGNSFSFPDVGASNVCFACHAGRVGGGDVAALSTSTPATDWTNVGFKNSHYMAAAGLMYVKIGYTNFVPANTQVAGTTGSSIVSYGQTLTADTDQTVDVNNVAVVGKVGSTHRKLGTPDINGDSHNPTIFVKGFLDSDGPCATCHYAKGSHTLEMDQKALDGVCINCHGAETGTTAEGLKLFIEEEGAEPFQAAMTLTKSLLLKKYNIVYDSSANPYFFEADANGNIKKDALGKNISVTNWTRSNVLTTALTAAQAEKLMGACFNLNVLNRDPAAHAHARTYARRLLYDSIDFLDDLTNNNQSVGATALASGLKDASGNDLFTKGAKAYNATDTADPTSGKYGITTPYSGTSHGMLYLLGWARSGSTQAAAGAWNAYERP